MLPQLVEQINCCVPTLDRFIHGQLETVALPQQLQSVPSAYPLAQAERPNCVFHLGLALVHYRRPRTLSQA